LRLSENGDEMKQINTWSLLVLLVLFSTVLSSSAVFAATVKIGGSGFALETMRILAGVYRQNHPEVAITVFPSLGSSGGIKAIMAGDLDIAISSRPLKEKEQGQSLKVMAFCKTPLVFVVHPQVEKKSISTEELAKIYGGEIQSWPDGSRIRLVLRPKLETDTTVIMGLSPAIKVAVADAMKRQGMILKITDQENLDALAKTPGGLGGATLNQLLSEQRQLKILALNGLTPSNGTLAEGSYPLSKTLYLVIGPGTSPAARQFLEFIASDQGEKILSQYGNLRLTEDGQSDHAK
jgi:phosphate transport system substrate-binding protein